MSVIPSADSISLLTIAEASQRAHVTPTVVRTWIWRYGFTTIKLDGQTLVSERELLRCEMERRRTAQQRPGNTNASKN